VLLAAAIAIAIAGVWVAVRRSGSDTALAPCFESGPIVKVSGRHVDEVHYPAPSSGTTYDARGATFVAYPRASLYPFSVGKDIARRRVCVVGGLVIGQQSRSLTWDDMKSSYDGDGLRIVANDWYVVDGLRVDNVEDGVAPRGTSDRYPKDGDGFTLRNLYFTYIRDDCVENDDIAGGVIFDSLFDGCYTGISERPGDGNPQLRHPAPRGETVVLDHVLLRLQAMPGPRGVADRKTLGHGQLFKWSEVANALVIRNSIFLVEQTPNSDSYFPFPPGTVTDNVTIIWLGSGSFRWSVPPGTTVTTDRTVWDDARATWLARHGCTSLRSCTKLETPDPLDREAAA
jgi:hypothetical protein